MASPSPHPFASPDHPGDVHVVLVLLEASAETMGCWPELQSYYLPILFSALQASSPDRAIHICWRTTADPAHQQSAVSASAGHIPDPRFDVAAPLSMAALGRAVEALQTVCRDAGEATTRHLIVVAVNPPQDPANFHTQGGHAPEAATRDAVIRTLRQERMRLHMLLGIHPRVLPLRDFHRQMLRAQISVEAPLWFKVDPRKFAFYLAAKPAPFEGRADAAAVGAPRSGPVTPTSTAVALPASASSGADSPRESTSATSPRRRSRAKGKDTAPPPMDPQGPGLVNYLKQVHGLTKKRNYGAKAGKRAAAASSTESTCAGTSSRPILPRLELPAANLVAVTPRPAAPRDSSATVAAPESAPPAAATATAAAGRYQPISPALPLAGVRTLSLDDSRRAPARRWPWLQPALVAPEADAPALTPETNAALRRLADMAPLVPPFAHPGAPPRPSQARQATYPPYGFPAGSSPSPPRRSPTQAAAAPYHPAVPVEYRTATDAAPPPPGYPSPVAAHRQQHAQMYGGQAHYGGYPYAVSPHASQAPSPLPSPTVTAAATARGDDAENAPFVVTQEYEALANARFEAAVLSGAMQACMSPSVLSPVSPGAGAGYFPAEPQADYVPYPGHDAMHYPPSADPSDASYYQQQTGPSSQWYGS